MEPIYNIDFFQGELDLIIDPVIKELTIKALQTAPAYIWYVTSSRTGKHHSPEDNQPGGLCWHLRKTVWMAYRMFSNLFYNTDIAIAAGLLHDIAQRGLNDEPEEEYEAYQRHGELAADWLWELPGDTCGSKLWIDIISCVASHMGRWGNSKPTSPMQITFHLADVAASTKGFASLYYDGDIEKYTVPELVGRKEYFRMDEDGDLVFTFGKKDNIKLKDVVRSDWPYLRWILRQGAEAPDNPKGFPAYMIAQIKEAMKPQKAEIPKKLTLF